LSSESRRSGKTAGDRISGDQRSADFSVRGTRLGKHTASAGRPAVASRTAIATGATTGNDVVGLATIEPIGASAAGTGVECNVARIDVR
jgi:hypothetical protein